MGAMKDEKKDEPDSIKKDDDRKPRNATDSEKKMSKDKDAKKEPTNEKKLLKDSKDEADEPEKKDSDENHKYNGATGRKPEHSEDVLTKLSISTACRLLTL